MNKIEEAITGHWGVRCSEYARGCPCCDAWAEYDAVRDAALEEAAKVAADYGDHSYAAKMISAAIRALMDNAPPK